ncbi:putative gamma-secretase subunit PEN-2 [Ananas comosus]|uniref:Putative gamma-secretase subunit PEN-2 n=1 Tax=Ananas comosus TaxID=4615 RepID=A0A199UL90_ANACO|nr:putative gamma-secretase subunit PEN-2 [Ananas comosus]
MERRGGEERRDEESHPRPRAHGGGGGGGGWPTVDGPLGLAAEDFFLWGFALLPFLWAVNCLYFWPVLRSPPSSSPSSFAPIRPYVVRSAIGFAIFVVLLSSWALTFAIGGERLFGPVWNNLVMYNVADKLGLTGWM